MRRCTREPLTAPESIEAILSRAGENRFARAQPVLPAKLWRDAVGARIAERVFPLSLYDATLVLRVSSSVWAHELSLLAEEVCARLRLRGVDVRRLRFRVSPLPPLERLPERRVARSVPARQAIPGELAAALRRIGDEGLREAIARAASANLAWQSSLVVPESRTEPGAGTLRLKAPDDSEGPNAQRSAAKRSSPSSR